MSTFTTESGLSFLAVPLPGGGSPSLTISIAVSNCVIGGFCITPDDVRRLAAWLVEEANIVRMRAEAGRQCRLTGR